MDDNVRLPQEILASALWMEWFYNWGVLRKNRVSELLRSYNLKPKKGKTVDDVILAFGRGLKDAGHNSKKTNRADCGRN